MRWLKRFGNRGRSYPDLRCIPRVGIQSRILRNLPSKADVRRRASLVWANLRQPKGGGRS